MKKRTTLSMVLGALLCLSTLHAQDDVMMQAFYWNVPVNEAGKNGSWYDTLRAKLTDMKSAGIRALWMPPPSKGNFGISDMGYGIFDHYDLGNYTQKGTTETRFGSRSELASLITDAHSTSGGVPYMDVYADVILNHIYTDNSLAQESGDNPAVKTYVFNKAVSGGTQRVPYPTNEIRWLIPNAAAGDYYIQISGYFLNYGGAVGERGYDVYFKFTDAAPPSPGSQLWEYEPNNGSGNYNVALDQRTYSGHMQNSSDIDEYKITLATADTIEIILTARREGTNPSTNAWEWQWAAQTNGYYPSAVWYNGSNIASSSLKAFTATAVDYVNHSGTGEPNYTWSYTNFHPVDAADYLGDGGSTEGGYEDQLVPNTKWFGMDFNTYDTVVQNRLKTWGTWLTNTIGFDGYRLDFVRGFQEDFVSDWVNNLPLKGGAQRFIVAEYFTGYKYRLKNWVNTLAGDGADVDVFDFPLKNTLTEMTNGTGASFNMAWLNHAGMVRDDGGNSLGGTSVVTFLENHDTGKEHDKWVTQDWKMGYAYILFAEGRPCLFYPQYYGVTQTDNHNPSLTVTPPSSLKRDIDKLMFIRRTYLNNSMIVLTEQGNPVTEPSPNGTTTFAGDTWNVYAARRQGNGTKSGGILVINNNNSLTRGIWVDNDGSPNGTATSGYSDWKNQVLVNALDTTQKTTVANDGRVHVWAPARGYAIWVLQSEYVGDGIARGVNPVPAAPVAVVADAAPAENSVRAFPNPAGSQTTIEYMLTKTASVRLEIFDANGRLVKVLASGKMGKGKYQSVFRTPVAGLYTYRLSLDKEMKTGRVMIGQ
ncbi:MAG: T9SS type A sorting domain-containing protein [Chitinophagaceae bacterium]|nr:T9SS type A sorting domain-containing protein [Chitinophagaceae bacterium]